MSVGWYCVNCGYVSKDEPDDVCPRCHEAVWERGKPSNEYCRQVARESPMAVKELPDAT